MYAEQILKKCSACGRMKEASEFWKRTLSPDGLAYICKKCDSKRYAKMKKAKGAEMAAKQKEWRDNNKKRIRDTKRKSKYGLDGAQIDKMREEQNYACAICNKDESEMGIRGLVVDHHHDSKITRGLLCDKCNRCLGLLGDDLKIIESAASYLKKYLK